MSTSKRAAPKANPGKGKASTCSFKHLLPEVLPLVFEHLSVADLLQVRQVNRVFFEAVSCSSSSRMIYNVVIGAQVNPASIRALIQTEFVYKNFRIVVPNNNDCSLPAGVDMRILLPKCSQALSFEFLDGGVRAGFFQAMARAAAKTLRAIYIMKSGDPLLDLFRGDNFAKLPQLHHLEFTGCEVTDAALAAALPCAPKLHALVLQKASSEPQYSPSGERVWIAEPCLESSSVNSPSNRCLTAPVLVDLLRRFSRQIESLDLTGIHVKDPVCFLQQLSEAASTEPVLQLKELCIGRNHIDLLLLDKNKEVVQHLAKRFPCVTSHDFSVKFSSDPNLIRSAGHYLPWLCKKEGLSTTPEGRRVFLKHLSGVKCLVICQKDFNGWRENVGPSFVEQLDLSCLTTLFLVNVFHWTPAQWKAVINTLAARKNKDILTTLSPQGSYGVTDEVLEEVLMRLRQLKFLSLNSCQITDNGLSRIPGHHDSQKPALSDLKDLVGLELGVTSVTDVTLEHGLNNPCLEFLSVLWTEVTDKGLQALNTTAKNLVDLDASFCKRLTESGIEHFIRNSQRVRGIGLEGNSAEMVRKASSMLPLPRSTKFRIGIFGLVNRS